MIAPENTGISTWRTRVHIYELDSLGHVNNANYFPYLQQATEAAWPQAADWTLRRLSMEYIVPALHGTELAVHVWEDAAAADETSLGYAIERCDDQQILLRARLVWETATGGDAVSAKPTFQPVADLPRDYQIKPARQVPEMPGGRLFRWQHQVRGYETGSDGAVSATQVLRWTEEARARAAHEIGWSYQRMGEADFVGVVTRHEFEFARMPRAGEEIEVSSRIYEVRRVRGTWRHELTCNGELLAAAFVSGGFLNTAGHPHPPPPALIDGLSGRGGSNVGHASSVTARSRGDEHACQHATPRRAANCAARQGLAAAGRSRGR